ncbi:tetratricopeptide repeat protein [Parabacteroides sp. FAFU027]|uniref:tetratricopeptide repeat protein n=1 Tax=Parabacteroides sp. FAFU027 TaxID=2922715 RepID=UPI001FAEFFE5|nr:tetratricopeptide repeat protein [Parabacteroides sp. FAFU027]
MKKQMILTLAVFASLHIMGQKSGKADRLFKELAENGCKSIDSIDTRNKSKEEIAKEISKCIDTQVEAYQMGAKLMNIDLSNTIADGKGKKTVNVLVNNDKDSKEYKECYRQMEQYLMDNCKVLKVKLSSMEQESGKSVSTNPEAREWYSKGVKESNSENYKKAITYFEKALAIDSVFAFAWDNLGICNRKLNNFDRAIYCYKRSLELDPNGLMPLQNIAVAYRYKQEYTQAIDAYQKLATLNPKDPEVFYGIGQTYSVMKEYEKGLDNICKAYSLYTQQQSPYRSDAEKMIVALYTEMKKQNKEEKFYEIMKANNISVGTDKQ